jgi:CubicO group peptidase (beta-lactamase class C family)
MRPIAAAAGRQFNYNGGGTVVMADMLVRATKAPLRELADTHLFAPLGITDWQWVADIYDRPLAFAELRLKPRDVLKIGRSMLEGGQWQGRRPAPVHRAGVGPGRRFYSRCLQRTEHCAQRVGGFPANHCDHAAAACIRCWRPCCSAPDHPTMSRQQYL